MSLAVGSRKPQGHWSVAQALCYLHDLCVAPCSVPKEGGMINACRFYRNDLCIREAALQIPRVLRCNDCVPGTWGQEILEDIGVWCIIKHQQPLRCFYQVLHQPRYHALEVHRPRVFGQELQPIGQRIEIINKTDPCGGVTPPDHVKLRKGWVLESALPHNVMAILKGQRALANALRTSQHNAVRMLLHLQLLQGIKLRLPPVNVPGSLWQPHLPSIQHVEGGLRVHVHVRGV
mmetsp:Transcript_77303/g.128959  ORF Transcript_77303/g.128959 Transcript_77303/m.128959 type:complete len:233 (-) Transcript_77303:1209-1907(-)